MLTTVRDRIGAATGALFVVLIMIGNQISMSGTDQSAHPSGAAVLKDAVHEAGSTASTIGFVLEFLGFVAFIGFIGDLADAWRRRADRTQGNIGGAIAVVAGIGMLAIKLGSIAPSGAVMLDRPWSVEQRDRAQTRRHAEDRAQSRVERVHQTAGRRSGRGDRSGPHRGAR